MSQESFKDFVLDQLSHLEGIRAKAMFGGHGFYLDAAFFGIIYKERLYFKTSDSSRPRYLRQDAKPFEVTTRRKQKKVSLNQYYEVPVEVLEDRDELEEWAREAARAGDR